MAKNGDRRWKDFFVDEYRLDYALHDFPKPVIALLDGVVMGGGMGIAQGAWLRVVTERTRLAMPETRIGLVPDVGASYFLSRVPIEAALYIGLSGTALSGPEAVFFNLADVCVSCEWMATFEQRLAAVPEGRLDPAFPNILLKTLRSVFVADTSIESHAHSKALMHKVKLYFRPLSGVDEILCMLGKSLKEETDPRIRTWLSETNTALLANSPTMLHVSRENILRGRHSSLGECFRRELGVVFRCFEEGEFLEGVRALLIDKDHRPRWAPMSVWEVRPERVKHFLTSPWRTKNHPLRDIESSYQGAPFSNNPWA